MWLKTGASTRKAPRIQGRLNLRFLTGQIFDHGSQILVRTPGGCIYAACHGFIPVQDHIQVFRKADLRSYILVSRGPVPRWIRPAYAVMGNDRPRERKVRGVLLERGPDRKMGAKDIEGVLSGRIAEAPPRIPGTGRQGPEL